MRSQRGSADVAGEGSWWRLSRSGLVESLSHALYTYVRASYVPYRLLPPFRSKRSSPIDRLAYRASNIGEICSVHCLLTCNVSCLSSAGYQWGGSSKQAIERSQWSRIAATEERRKSGAKIGHAQHAQLSITLGESLQMLARSHGRTRSMFRSKCERLSVRAGVTSCLLLLLAVQTNALHVEGVAANGLLGGVCECHRHEGEGETVQHLRGGRGWKVPAFVSCTFCLGGTPCILTQSWC
jgi:hypothetical protein